jgi:ligand-binding SRPBCC domain-containing protein
MLTFSDTSHISASPNDVWRFFADMESHYLEWHPEHVVWRNLEGDATIAGSVIYADEHLGRLRLKGKFFIDHVEPERFFDFRVGFPFSLVNAGGHFRIRPTADGGCDLEAENHVGYDVPVIGRLLDRVLAKVMPADDLYRHMREEGENLDRLLNENARYLGGAALTGDLPL